MNTRIASWLVGLSSVLAGTVQAGDTYFIHADHLGTPQVITDDAQTPNVVWKADYNPFGEASLTTQTIDNPLRFPGQYHDEETGIHYNYFRDYSPQLGRYLQSDPIGLNGGLNTYGYVSATPLNRTDRLGLQGRIFTLPGPVPLPVIVPAPTTGDPLTRALAKEFETAVGRICFAISMPSILSQVMANATTETTEGDDTTPVACPANDCPVQEQEPDDKCKTWLEELRSWYREYTERGVRDPWAYNEYRRLYKIECQQQKGAPEPPPQITGLPPL